MPSIEVIRSFYEGWSRDDLLEYITELEDSQNRLIHLEEELEKVVAGARPVYSLTGDFEKDKEYTRYDVDRQQFDAMVEEWKSNYGRDN